jgi:hypothetical protein
MQVGRIVQLTTFTEKERREFEKKKFAKLLKLVNKKREGKP